MSQPAHNPFETPRPRGVRFLQGTLRVFVAAQCFGMAASHLHQKRPDLFCEMLGTMRDLPADQITHLGNIISYALIACGVLTLLRPSTFVLFPIIIYQSATAFAAILQSVGPLPVLEPALQLTRSITPLALLLVDFWPPRLKPTLVLCLSAVSLLRTATAITFLAQGIVLLDQCQHGGSLVDLIQSVAQHGIQRELSADLAQRCLGVWGAILFGLAFSLMASRNRAILIASILAGLLSAFSFTVADGPSGYSQSLIRASLIGAPLAVLIFQITSIREQKPAYLAEKQKASVSTTTPVA